MTQKDEHITVNNFFKRTWAQIDLDNLKHNYNIIKNSLHPNTGIIAVVKADAYGHGADVVAEELSGYGVSIFAVSNLEEALSLRKSGITDRVLILGPTPAEYTALLCENGIEQTIHTLDYAFALNDAAENANGIIRAHIKIDTGMSRIGFNARQTDFVHLANELKALSSLDITAAFSHLSHADSKSLSAREFTNGQKKLFCGAVSGLKTVFPEIKTHLQNSAGIVDYQGMDFDYARPGIILYGLAPSEDMEQTPGFRPVMELKSCVTDVKTVSAGTPIGYSRAFVTERETVVATVPIGYADGYPRHLSSKGTMLINGRRAKVIGNVCMDQVMLDVTGIEDVRVGSTVTVYGNEKNEYYGADCAARDAGTISYELVCLVSKRVPRVYIKNGEIFKVSDLILG